MKLFTGNIRNTFSSLDEKQNDSMPVSSAYIGTASSMPTEVASLYGNSYVSQQFAHNEAGTVSSGTLSASYLTATAPTSFATHGLLGGSLLKATPAMTIAGAIDHAGPVTGEMANGATTDDTRPILHGTGTANTLVNVVADMIGADGKPVASFEVGKAIVQQDGTLAVHASRRPAGWHL
jgi:hypothetical protein